MNALPSLKAVPRLILHASEFIDSSKSPLFAVLKSVLAEMPLCRIYPREWRAALR